MVGSNLIAQTISNGKFFKSRLYFPNSCLLIFFINYFDLFFNKPPLVVDVSV